MIKKKLVKESLSDFLYEVSDEYVAKAVNKAEKEGRKVSPEYKQKLSQKQDYNKDAAAVRKRQEIEVEKKKLYALVNDLNGKLKEKIFNLNNTELTLRTGISYTGVYMNDSQYYFKLSFSPKDSTKIVCHIEYTAHSPKPNTVSDISDMQNIKFDDEMISCEVVKDGALVPLNIDFFSDYYVILSQVFKAIFPTSRYADRKTWSGLSGSKDKITYS